MPRKHMKLENAPGKDFANAIWDACFDYQDLGKVINGETIEERIYNCWQRLHQVAKHDPQALLDAFRGEPDLPNH